ncbi:hypothetical protein PRN20_18150 [Devosia sp. ZB163]|jgi:hypothetical protein|uniref:hypothetical protein n=1 Tax=Devosia sp. ZB163 TaxID=3025938 RepID=UPI0023619276|nr:hypothetical protein [Devosia sp. ZB163]MDC9825660.1 hypothetical protein [Devosia sp. ZB163]
MLAARTYLEAIEGYSVEAIRLSVGQFIGGKVEWHDGRFAPSAAELAKNVRQWHDAIKVVEQAKNPPQLASGILSIDYGRGRIDMTKLTLAEQNEVLRTGQAPNASLPDGTRLARLGEKSRGYGLGSPESDDAAA